MAKNVRKMVFFTLSLAIIMMFLMTMIAPAQFDPRLTNRPRATPEDTESPLPSPSPSPAKPKVEKTPVKTETPVATPTEEVNVRLLNDSTRIYKIMRPNFISGFHLLEEKLIQQKGKGFLGGDCSIRKVWFSKTKADFIKMKEEKKEYRTDATTIVITVDFYPSKKEAEKMAATRNLKEVKDEKAIIGDATWSGYLKADPRAGEKEGNYNSYMLVVIKSNVQIYILAYNYMSEPSEEVWNAIQDSARKIANQIK